MAEKIDTLEFAKENSQVNMGTWISRAWELLFSDLGYFLILTLIYVLVTAVASATVVGVFIVMGPLTVGLYYAAFKKIQGKSLQIGDISKGFNFFAAALISSILVAIFITVGFTLCIIPGFIVSALYLFTPIFILDKNLDFWNAMEASRKLAQKHLFELSVFIILLGLINIVGAILCGVGLLITFPLSILAIAVGYDELVGFETDLQ